MTIKFPVTAIIGATGQVGGEVFRLLRQTGNITPLSIRNYLSSSQDMPALLLELDKINPDVIINTAAFTQVDDAEENYEKADLLNHILPARLSDFAQARNALLVHYSSDYVFDGSGTSPKVETDTPHPINVYGQTKLEGDKTILSSGCPHLIFRCSWVYSSNGKNFMQTVLKKIESREPLRVVNNQIGSPTSAKRIALCSVKAIKQTLKDPSAQGLYHLAARGYVSWFEFAKYILRQAPTHIRNDENFLLPLSSLEPNRPAKRPLNSRLDTSKFQKTFKCRLPDWRKDAEQTLKEIAGSLK